MKKNIEGVKVNKNVLKIMEGSILSVIISIVILFLYAGILVSTDISEETIKPVVITISIISILIGSFISSIKIKKKGILNGCFVGGIYISVLYIISSIFIVGFSINLYSIIIISGGIIAGMMGGILGVNFSLK